MISIVPFVVITLFWTIEKQVAGRAPVDPKKLDLIIDAVGTVPGISLNVVEGEPIILTCRIKGNGTSNYLRWEISRDENISSSTDLEKEESRVQVNNTFNENGQLVSTLSIESSAFTDRAYYYCHGENDWMKSSARIIVRVKDKLAALWPFLGIVGEVVILSTIILIYEKNRVKIEMDDVLGDAEISNVKDPASSTTAKKQEIRQRK